MELLDEKRCEKHMNHYQTRETLSTQHENDEDLNNLAETMYNIVLEGWMHGYGQTYTKDDYMCLFNQIRDLIAKQLPIRFLLPAFPCKSSNDESKVLGPTPDLAEFLAIRSLITTARKLQEIYSEGVLVTLMSDYHTFDQYVGVTEERYKAYHEGLKQMIHDAGADDIIELISLTTFPELHNVPQYEISTRLTQEYGDPTFVENFEKSLIEKPAFAERYLHLTKFMFQDLSHKLPGSPTSTESEMFIQKTARGMMAQGVALDNFLEKQDYVKNYIRLSIHEHHPKSNKFAVNLFKQVPYRRGNVLYTPWHNTILFDSSTGGFVIDHKANILADNDGKQSVLVKVRYDDKDWFYLKLNFSEEYKSTDKDVCFKAKMVKQGCGIILTNKNTTWPLKSNCLHNDSLTTMIKEFGIVVLRGFDHFKNEKEIIETYSKRATNGIVNWAFGMIHKVAPNDELAGIVNSKGALNVHFDLTNPPKYMGITQSKYQYKDYVPREFLLYCRKSGLKGQEGATTFIDAHGAVLSLNGAHSMRLKSIVVSYQTELAKDEGKVLYFGGRGNIFEYPLVHNCPWTGKDVFRWQQSWKEQEHPEASQYFWLDVKSSSDKKEPSADEVDFEMQRIVFDDRFYFEHGYEEGDQVYVNNYTMLHGRKSFSNNRELWRLQAIPPSDNLPPYFLANSSIE